MQRFAVKMLVVGLLLGFSGLPVAAQMPDSFPMLVPRLPSVTEVGPPRVAPDRPLAPEPFDRGFSPPPTATPPSDASPRFVGDGSHGEPRVRVICDEGSQLVGEIAEDTKLDLKTSFGDVAVRWTQIQQLKWVVDQKKLQVDLKSGDHLLGEPSTGEVVLETSWGEMKLKLTQIEEFAAGELVEVSLPITHIGSDGRTVSTTFHRRKVFRSTSPNRPDDSRNHDTPLSPRTSPPRTAPGVPTFSAPPRTQ